MRSNTKFPTGLCPSIDRTTREMIMRALVFDGQLRLDSTYPAPALLPGEALIRPHLVGICNTDIEIIRGYMGFHGVLGHEFVGTVVACGDQTWLGKRVVGEINAACFTCATCRGGDSSHCPQRTTLGIDRRDGAMADLLQLPIACLHEVPAAVSDVQAVFVEPLAAALAILEQTHIRPTDHVAVIGDGKLGLLCAQALRLSGCALAVIGRHPERWGLLHDLGIQAISSADSERLPVATFDLVVDCTGNGQGLQTARRLIRPRGRLVLKSTFNGESPINLSMIVVDEVQLIGSRCGPFAPALRLLERGLIETEALVAARFMLPDAQAAFRAARGQMKILLEV